MSADTPAPSETPAYDALSRRDRALIDEYLSNGFVQWKAYRDKSYTGKSDNPASMRALSSKKFADVNIRAALEERLNRDAIEAGEVLFRLSQQARNPQMEFLNGKGKFDLEGIIEAGLSHLVKGTKYDKAGRLIIEFYDAQAALKELSRIRGLTGPRGTEDDPIHTESKQVIVIAGQEVRF